MRILSIKAKNYRTLLDLELEFSRNYCTVSGKNNAGKSSLISLLSILFGIQESIWTQKEPQFSYKDDRTQWAKGNFPIEVVHRFELTRDDDPALISFIEKMASVTGSSATIPLELRYVVNESDETKVTVVFEGKLVDEKLLRKLIRR